ncbi:S8 family serine peptidase [Piscirickettsia litoralis]|uniref:Peptidase S8/S53 domain-containing protein n=1 Tax=Piscirickettsia litoralis TaxID=1891921 RepID=A0ABX3A5Z5_9GAMM|nr:S8 family serine peptidase [Piscirickettsia litoralis]ODN43073.1 hypothetical protein BGC07_09300 [Piscirickettsia litoralis]
MQKRKLSLAIAVAGIGLLSQAYAGEVNLIVKYKPENSSLMNLNAMSSSSTSGLKVTKSQPINADTQLVTVETKDSDSMLLMSANSASAGDSSAKVDYKTAREFMDAHPDVVYALPAKSTMKAFDVQKKAISSPNTGTGVRDDWGKQWDMDSDGYGYGIGVNEAWRLIQNPAGTYVAVVDTGLAVQAPEDISKEVVDNGLPYFHYENNKTVVDYNVYQQSGHFHGTHVAGTIDANGPEVTGVAGPIDSIKVAPVKALADEGSGNTYAIMEAVKWSAGVPVSGVQTNNYPAKVINLSLGMSRYYTENGQEKTYYSESYWKNNVIPSMCAAWYDAAKSAEDEGATLVIAAGNDSHELWNDIPSGCQNFKSIVVEATGPTGKKSYYSTYSTNDWKLQSTVVRAPGGDADFGEAGEIYSTVNDGYGYMQGTSMATPHVAGMVSLIYSVDPTVTPDDVATILNQSAYDNTGVLSAQKVVSTTINRMK